MINLRKFIKNKPNALLFFILCLSCSFIIGFAGGTLGYKIFFSKDEKIIEDNSINFENTDSSNGLSTSEVVALVENSVVEIETIINSTDENTKVKDTLKIQEEAITIDNKDTNQSVTLRIPAEDPKGFIKLQDRKTKTQYKLKDGIIITEKLADLLEVEEKDTLEFTGTNSYKEKIAHITENYLFHYIYLPKESYKEDTYNTILIKTKEMTEKEEKTFANELKEIKGVSSITFTSSTRHIFDDMMDNFAYVSLILIISAGALAFVVLYNLSSVNISERRRELATIKVLGFYDKEVYQYINRENTILTIIGILLGLGIGNILTMYIIKTCEIDMLMFNPTIALASYIYAILITAVFAILVNIILYFSLKKIDMIESLKSVE